MNLQFIRVSDGKIQLRPLATKEPKENHSGFHLKTVLDEVIEQYGIKSNQIYSSQSTTVPTCTPLFVKRM